MPPRSFTNPAPVTESAREARKNFFCELCQKGYGRMNDYEAHQSSYDHQHKKRLKDMKQMQRDPSATEKARKAERKAEEKSGLITIKPLKLEGSSGKGGFKKGGFKSAFGPPAGMPSTDDAKAKPGFKKMAAGEAPSAEVAKQYDSEDDDVGYEYYDPRRPTGCDGSCGGVAN
ncbi:hypothetical protein BT63DRAFT_75602 [Microthyrium microscopicum]|uniref:C2H2-type domain-containing protein n=1 Tax=Microthyrium microscopicum TaxID=703497 RepID=A0A6A6U2B9_9PEZI|nr:hypothetical protein BT63DRAFT_75602 [Microthyrium microscopicum]